MGCKNSKIKNDIQEVFVCFSIEHFYISDNSFFGKTDLKKYQNFIRCLKKIIKKDNSCKNTKYVKTYLKKEHPDFYQLLVNDKYYQKYILKLNVG